MTDHKNLTAALVAFQAELPDVSKGSTNPAFKSRYADLADVTKAVFPVLAKHGLAFTAVPDETEHGYVLRYELRHVSGESIKGVWPLPESAKAQEYGSWITYGRRYTLSAVTGITPDEDDDGNSTGPAAAPRKRMSPQARATDTADRIATAVRLINATTDASKLDEYETLARERGIDGHPDVKAALEAKRSEVGHSLTDHWATAPIPGES